MCWTGKIQDHIKCVEVDIKVFKIVRMDKGKLLPYFHASLMPEGYEVGKRYQTTLSMSDIRDDSDTVHVNSGFHSYYCSNYLAEFTKRKVYIGPLPFSEGMATAYPNNCALMQCTIPKGAELFINRYGEVVSNEIVVDGIWRPSLFQRLTMRLFNSAYRADTFKPMIT
jgi:hypothetical protein